MSSIGSVALIGSRSTLSVIGFHVLLELGLSVPLVISGEEDPGIDDWRFSLVKAALGAGYELGRNLLVLKNPHHPEILDTIRGADVDILLSLQWRRILRSPLLTLPRRGTVNLHNAPLPLLRGCDPFSWAIDDGLETMGVTLHQVVDEGIDSGPILTQRFWPINETTTAWSLYQDSLEEAEKLLRHTICDIVAGRLISTPQEPRYATYHPLGQFRFRDLEADWKLPAATLSAALRSRIFLPFQVPFFFCQGKKVEILGCCALPGPRAPGVVVSLEPLRIGTKSGLVELIELRADNQVVSGAEFASTCGLVEGESLV